MVINLRPLTPTLIKLLIENEEIPARSRLLEAISVQEIFRYGATVASIIHRFRKLPRCMDHARSLILDYEKTGRSFPCGMVIVADELTGGRGRFNRDWHAPRGGLWLTLVLVNTLLPRNTALIPLAVGAACCETIRHFGINARIKWVNDILAGGRKIAGVLAETMTGPESGEEYILAGVGINVNNDLFPEGLAHQAVSMKSMLKTELNMEMVAARLFTKLSWNIGILHYEDRRDLENSGTIDGEHGMDHMLLKSWQNLSDTIGRKVRFAYNLEKGRHCEAYADGIDSWGGLILKLEADGRSVVERSGEIIYLD